MVGSIRSLRSARNLANVRSFVRTGKPAVADHIGGQYRREFPFLTHHAFPLRGKLNTKARRGPEIFLPFRPRFDPTPA
jgi:hypothetical protein